MKTVSISQNADEVNALLEQARDDDVLVQTADGTEFMVSIVDDFDHEVARTQQNTKLMALLDERAKKPGAVPLSEARRLLDLSD